MSYLLIHPAVLRRGFSHFGPMTQRGLSSLSSSPSQQKPRNGYSNTPIQSSLLSPFRIGPSASALSVFQHQSLRHASGTAGTVEHDHVKLWTAEKMVSASLLGLFPLAFIAPNFITNSLLAFTVCIHSHWGIEAIVVDYVRPSVFGPAIPKIALGLVYALSAATLGGLLYFNYNDVGIVNAIKILWGVKN